MRREVEVARTLDPQGEGWGVTSVFGTVHYRQSDRDTRRLASMSNGSAQGAREKREENAIRTIETRTVDV